MNDWPRDSENIPLCMEREDDQTYSYDHEQGLNNQCLIESLKSLK